MNESTQPSGEKDQRENLAARMFLADPARTLPGPFMALPEEVKDRYRTLSQVAEDEFARRARRSSILSGQEDSMNTSFVALTDAEKAYIESKGDPGTGFYWLAVEEVFEKRIEALRQQDDTALGADLSGLATAIEAGEVEKATHSGDGTMTLTFKNSVVTVEVKTVEDRFPDQH